MTSWRRVWRRLEPARGWNGIVVTPSAAERAAFRAYAREQTWRAYPKLGLFIASLVALWWPLDFLVFQTPFIRSTYHELRLVLVPATLVAAGLYAALPVCRRHPGPLAVAFVAAVAGLTAYYMGRAGDFGGPWFHFLYGMPMLTIPLVAPPWRRLLGAGVIAVAVWGCFLAAAPSHWSHPLHLAAVSFLAFSTLLATLIGHLGYRLVHANFVHRNRLAADERALRELNERLGTIVDERTAELRRLAQHVERVREDERRWLAHELHDELGQELAALRYAVATARGEHVPPELLREHVADVGDTIERMTTTMRRILHGLRPAVLDERGAAAALRWLARDVGGRGEIEVGLALEPDDMALDSERGTAVFRIVQEALTNVVRHARASRADVRVTCEDGTLDVVVADDGVGMGTRRSGDGMGLVSIRERARALGGAATWSARDGGGTVLSVTLPVAAPAGP